MTPDYRILVVYTTKIDGDMEDHYYVFDRMDEASARYADLIERDDVYTANICLPIMSTDYPINPKIKWN